MSIKPCSTCLKARQNLLRMGGTPERRLVELTNGDVVLNSDHTIAEVRPRGDAKGDWVALVGHRVYIAGKGLLDVSGKEPVKLTDLGRIIKVSPLTE